MCFFTFSIEGHFSNGPSTCDIKDIHDVNILLTDDCDTLNINDKKYVFKTKSKPQKGEYEFMEMA